MFSYIWRLIKYILGYGIIISKRPNCNWVKFSADDNVKYFSYFSQKTGFDISCKLSETICMKYQTLFSGKKKKNITNLSSAELAKRVVKIKTLKCYFH